MKSGWGSACLLVISSNTEQVTFPCLGKLSVSFLNLDQLPFCPLHFQCHEISQSSFNVIYFFLASITFSGTFSSFCHFPPLRAISSPLLVVLVACLESLEWFQCQHFHAQLCFLNSTYIQFEFHFMHYHFLYLSSLLFLSPSFLY